MGWGGTKRVYHILGLGTSRSVGEVEADCQVFCFVGVTGWYQDGTRRGPFSPLLSRAWNLTPLGSVCYKETFPNRVLGSAHLPRVDTNALERTRADTGGGFQPLTDTLPRVPAWSSCHILSCHHSHAPVACVMSPDSHRRQDAPDRPSTSPPAGISPTQATTPLHARARPDARTGRTPRCAQPAPASLPV